MSQHSHNWLKFGALVSLAFVLGLFFAGLLDLPTSTVAQDGQASPATLAARPAQVIPGSQPLVDLSDAFAAVAETVRSSVVFITAERPVSVTRRNVPPGFEPFFPNPDQQRAPNRVQGGGSGFVVSRDGYILTNNHVVEGAEKVEVRMFDQRRFEARVVGTDPLTDVAVLKVDARNLSPIALGRSSSVRVGEWVLAVGNPLGDALTFTVTSGIVSAKGRGTLGLPGRTQTSIQDFIQTDAAINPGNSGGPLVNVRGEVIGINSAIASQTGTYVGYGFAIPIDLVRHVMDQLIETGTVQRAALGVQVVDASPEDAEYVDLPQIRGVKVQDFTTDDSPARRAGLQPGDIIVSVDGSAVEYVAQLQQEVGFRKPGQTVKVEVARKGGIRKTYDVRLVAQAPATEVAQSTAADEAPTRPRASSSIAKLGISVEPVTPQWTEQLDLQPNFRGVVVTEVEPGGPADSRNANGLFSVADGSPDLIIAVEGAPIRSEADLQSAMRSVQAGELVSVTVYNSAVNGGQGGRRVVRIRAR